MNQAAARKMRRPTDLLVVGAPPLEAVFIVPKGLGLVILVRGDCWPCGQRVMEANEILYPGSLLERQSPAGCPRSRFSLIPKVSAAPLAILAVSTLTSSRGEGQSREETGKPTTALREYKQVGSEQEGTSNPGEGWSDY